MENYESNSININNNIFKPGGAIGRLTYFWQGLVFGLFEGVMVGILEGLLILGKKLNPVVLSPIILLNIIIILLSIYVYWLLLHKRCVDILGKKEHSVLMAIGMIIASLIPYIGFIPPLYTLFAKGKISSKVSY